MLSVSQLNQGLFNLMYIDIKGTRNAVHRQRHTKAYRASGAALRAIWRMLSILYFN
jgi:hypothetical protein